MKLGWKKIAVHFSYLVVGCVAVGLALFITSQTVKKSHSQEDGDPVVDAPPPGLAEENAMDNPPPLEPPVPGPPPGGVPTAEEGALPPPMEVPPQDTASPDLPPGPDPNLNQAPGDGDSLSESMQTFLQPFIYQGDNRRDPFEPYREIKPMTQGELAGPLLPLQRFDLDNIKLIGIMWDVRSPKAMFLDPTNKVHILGKDDRIGRANGYIAVIREGEVVVVETVNIRGEMAYSTRVLSISR